MHKDDNGLNEIYQDCPWQLQLDLVDGLVRVQVAVASSLQMSVAYLGTYLTAVLLFLISSRNL